MSEENKKINPDSSSFLKKNSKENKNIESNNENENVESGQKSENPPVEHNLKLESETIVRSVFTKGSKKRNLIDPQIHKNPMDVEKLPESNSAKSFTILNRIGQSKNDLSNSNLLKKTNKTLNFNITLTNNDLFVKSTSRTAKKSKHSSLDDLNSKTSLEKNQNIDVVNEKDNENPHNKDIVFIKSPKRQKPKLKDKSKNLGEHNQMKLRNELADLDLDDDDDELKQKKGFGLNHTVNVFYNRLKRATKTKFNRRRFRIQSKLRADQEFKGPYIYDFEASREEDLSVKTYFQQVFFYVLYLIILTVVAVHSQSANMFYYKDITVQLFFETPFIPNIDNMSVEMDTSNITRGKSLSESRTLSDFWSFIETTMINLFYDSFFFPPLDYSQYIDDDRELFYENEILGVPRMRQVRVEDNSCLIHPSMQRFFQHCFSYYSIYTEETEPIKTGMEGKVSATAWTYSEAKDLNTSSYWGEISIYGGGGYYVDLGRTKESAINIINELRDNEWISRATRAVFIDFNIYNANVNYFCLCKIVIEFPPMGGIIPHADFHPVKLIKYLWFWDFVVLGLEFVRFTFLIYFIYILCVRFISQKLQFIFFFWNIFEFFLILLSIIHYILTLYLYIYVSKVIKSLSERFTLYTEFDYIKKMHIFYTTNFAFIVLFSWVKLIKYLNYNTIMIEFQDTISRSVGSILAFFPMFFSMFTGFSLLGFLLFGSQIRDYRTWWSSSLALLQTIIGEFEYQEIQSAEPVFGPIFYIAYIFFMVFLTLNVFIAIITDAYSHVKNKVTTKVPKHGHYLKRGFMNILAPCGLDKKVIKFNVKEKYVYNEIISTLKRAGFTDAEIKIFFSKYDINMNNILSESIKDKIINDLEFKIADYEESAEEFEIKLLKRRINEVYDKIEDIESNLQPILDKVDALLHKY